MNEKVQAIQDELTVIKNTKGEFNNLVFLFFTVSIFIAAGLVTASMKDIIILVVVLFIHELGHLAGMKLFKYRDLKILFIPFLGAAASGREINPNGLDKGIVSLMGPLPGILIGILVLFIFPSSPDGTVQQVAVTFFAINAFNLLPLFPLDGGRFFEYILFSRNVYIELAFKAVTIIAFLVLSIFLESIALVVLSLFLIIGLRYTYRIARITRALKNDASPQPAGLEEGPGNDFIEKALPHVEARISPKYGSRTTARYVYDVWNKVYNRPPGVPATVALLSGYFIVMILCTLLVSAFYIGSGMIQQENWQTFSPAEGGFSILMPADPKKNAPATGKEKRNPEHVYNVHTVSGMFFVIYSDIGELKDNKAPGDYTAKLKDKILKESKGTLLADREFLFHGNPAREFILALEGNSLMKLRVYVIPKRVFITYAVTRKNEKVQQNVDKFLDSFSLQPEKKGK